MSPLLIFGAFFLFVMGSVVAAGYLVMNRSGAPAVEASSPSPLLAITQPNVSPGGTVYLDFLRKLGERFSAANRANNPLRKQLLALGYRWPGTVPVFYGIKTISALIWSVLLFAVGLLFASSFTDVLLPTLCGLAIGFMCPDQLLKFVVKRRIRKLRSALPAALDLMVIGVESGQAFDQCIRDTSRGLRVSHPELSSELSQVSLELRAATSRVTALRNLAERCNEPELRKIVSVLIDSDRFGTSLAPALRSHARYLRTRFRQAAQESARKVGVKLIFPIFFLIFPAVLLVTLGPALIMMYQQFHTMLQ